MPSVYYNGYKYTTDHAGYYRKGSSSQNDYERLHRRVYEDNNGPIPEGWHVHHIDGDKENNEPDNLVALEPSEHIKEHHPESIAAAIEAAKEWHSTEVGRKWHSEHAKVVYSKRVWAEKCGACGESFTRQCIQRPKYCSNACRSAARRRSGVDSISKKCKHCSAVFESSKYQKRKYCSRGCAVRARSR